MGAENLIQTQHIKHRSHLRAKKKPLSSVGLHLERQLVLFSNLLLSVYISHVFFLVEAVLYAVAMIQRIDCSHCFTELMVRTV